MPLCPLGCCSQCLIAPRPDSGLQRQFQCNNPYP